MLLPRAFAFMCQRCRSCPAPKLRRKQWIPFLLALIFTSICIFIYANNKSSLSVTRVMKRFLFSASRSVMKRKPICHFYLNNTEKGPITAHTDARLGISDLEQQLSPSLQAGGHFIPSACRSRQKVAIIVPYRDRKFHLKLFLRHMHPFLQRQNFEYSIFVVQQDGTESFNRAILMNIGFVESLKLHNFSCFVFHDVDLLPLDDRIYYSCTDEHEPIHLSRSIDSHKNELMYTTLFGGACMMSREIVEKVNGFSNLYFGWGGEDDDMSYRVRSHGMYIVRYPHDVARYTMLGHAKADPIDRKRLLTAGRGRIHKDGLNSLKYEVVDFKLLPLYTWIVARFNKTAILEERGIVDKAR